MPDHDEKLCGTSPKEIVFDACPEDLALLLNIFDDRPIDKSLTWSDLLGALELGSKYEFLHLERHVTAHVKLHRPTGDPWSVFALASNLDLPLMAQSTLADFRLTHLGKRGIDQVKARDMSGVAGEYATALLRAMRQNVGPETYGYDSITGQAIWFKESDWKGVSRDLDLDK